MTTLNTPNLPGSPPAPEPTSPPLPAYMQRNPETLNGAEAMDIIIQTRSRLQKGETVSVDELRYVTRLIPIARSAAMGRAAETKAASPRGKKAPAAPVNLSSF